MAAPNQKITTPTIAGIEKALTLLQEETDQRRKDINAWLVQKKSVSAEDEVWLDEAGNLVDEVVLVESLAAVPDLDEAVKNLNEHQRGVHAHLIEKIQPSVSKKRKHKHMKQLPNSFESVVLINFLRQARKQRKRPPMMAGTRNGHLLNHLSLRKKRLQRSSSISRF